MSGSDRLGGRLLKALGDRAPAFRRRPYPPTGGFGRRLLIALADAAPAFRPSLSADAARQTGGVPASGRQPADGNRALRRSPAAQTLQDEFDEALSMLRDAAPDPAHPVGQAETSHLAVRLAATAADDGTFTVAVTVTRAPERPGWLAAATMALEVGGEYFVTTLSPAGTAAFGRLPGGEWRLWRIRGRRGAPDLALPLPRSQAGLAAAGKSAGSAVVTVVLPDSETRLTLHRERHGGYDVEVNRPALAGQPLILAVRYGTEDGGEGLVVVPARHTGLARLDGFSPASPWEVSFTTAASLPVLGAVTVIASVRAAANNATKRAWREIASGMPEVHDVIDAGLGGTG
jgi:hypothetical protein